MIDTRRGFWLAVCALWAANAAFRWPADSSTKGGWTEWAVYFAGGPFSAALLGLLGVYVCRRQAGVTSPFPYRKVFIAVFIFVALGWVGPID